MYTQTVLDGPLKVMEFNRGRMLHKVARWRYVEDEQLREGESMVMMSV